LSLHDALPISLWAVNDYKTASTVINQGGEALTNYSSTRLPVIAGHAIAVTLPALLIVAAVTWLLIYGVRESARTNNVIVITKVAVVGFELAFGASLIHPTNWPHFVPPGIGGVLRVADSRTPVTPGSAHFTYLYARFCQRPPRCARYRFFCRPHEYSNTLRLHSCLPWRHHVAADRC